MPKKPTYNYDLNLIEGEFNKRALNGELPKLCDVFRSLGYPPEIANQWLNRNAFKMIRLTPK